MPDRPAPKHILIHDEIAAAIAAGVYAPGQQLPTEKELVKSFNASRPTVARAMQRLAAEGLIDRRSGSVIVLDQDGSTEVARYNFFEAWPCKWNVPDMNADSSAMAIEKVEIAVERVERG